MRCEDDCQRRETRNEREVSGSLLVTSSTKVQQLNQRPSALDELADSRQGMEVGGPGDGRLVERVPVMATFPALPRSPGARS
jgi:hypothetical protein